MTFSPPPRMRRCAASARGSGISRWRRASTVRDGEFPPGLDPAPTSVLLAGCAAVTAPALFLERLAPAFARRLADWRIAGLSGILEALDGRWQFAPGDRLSVEWQDQPCAARYLGVSPGGALRVRLEGAA